jgi:hypothetical protein
MNTKKWILPTAASLLAWGAVSLGSAFESEAQAANQSWDFKAECSEGCTLEEGDEYYHDGAYGQEVMSEPGPGNREEMLELAARSQTWCSRLLTAMNHVHAHIQNHDLTCVPPRLGW